MMESTSSKAGQVDEELVREAFIEEVNKINELLNNMAV